MEEQDNDKELTQYEVVDKKKTFDSTVNVTI